MKSIQRRAQVNSGEYAAEYIRIERGRLRPEEWDSEPNTFGDVAPLTVGDSDGRIEIIGRFSLDEPVPAGPIAITVAAAILEGSVDRLVLTVSLFDWVKGEYRRIGTEPLDGRGEREMFKAVLETLDPRVGARGEVRFNLIAAPAERSPPDEFSLGIIHAALRLDASSSFDTAIVRTP